MKKPFDTLTFRERQVCNLVVLGLSNREIGIHLGCAPATVKRHCEALFGKYEVGGRVMFAVARTREMLMSHMAHDAPANGGRNTPV